MTDNSSLSNNSISRAQIYDGGQLSPIAAEDLEGNLTAIKQLINEHNENIQKLEEVERTLQETRAELEFQNTYPYVAIFAAAANIIGTILVGVGVNLTTSESGDENNSKYAILILGAALVFFANAFTIAYRWVRVWFNKKK